MQMNTAPAKVRVSLLPAYPDLSVVAKPIPDVEPEDRNKKLSAIGLVENSTLVVETMSVPLLAGTHDLPLCFGPEDTEGLETTAATSGAHNRTHISAAAAASATLGKSGCKNSGSGSAHSYNYKYSRAATPLGNHAGGGPALGVTGLTNLGNTCYMNSGLQCLMNVPQLRHYLLSEEYKRDINLDNPLGWGGEVAEGFAGLLRRTWSLQLFASVSPFKFKHALGKINQTFSGYGQQDSQELLAFLMDGLHEDLNRIQKKPPTQSVEGTEFPDDASAAREAWQRHRLRNSSVMVDQFQGQFRSSVVCSACSKTSITFDPYMHLSLPLPVHSDKEHEFLFYPRVTSVSARPSPVHRLRLNLPRHATYRLVKQKLQEAYAVDPEQLLAREVFQHRFFMSARCGDADLVSDQLENDVICFFEIKPFKNKPPPLPPRPVAANWNKNKEIRVHLGLEVETEEQLKKEEDQQSLEDRDQADMDVAASDVPWSNNNNNNSNTQHDSCDDHAAATAAAVPVATPLTGAGLASRNEEVVGHLEVNVGGETSQCGTSDGQGGFASALQECAVCTCDMPLADLYMHLTCSAGRQGVCEACFQQFQTKNEDAAAVSEQLLYADEMAFKCPMCLSFDQESAWQRMQPAAEAGPQARAPPDMGKTRSPPPPIYTRSARISVLQRRQQLGAGYASSELFGIPFVVAVEMGKTTGAELHAQVRQHLQARGVLVDVAAAAASASAASASSPSSLSSYRASADSGSGGGEGRGGGDDSPLDDGLGMESEDHITLPMGDALATTATTCSDDHVVVKSVAATAATTMEGSTAQPAYQLFCTDETGVYCRACSVNPYSYSSYSYNKCNGCQPIADSDTEVLHLRTDVVTVHWNDERCCDAVAAEALVDHESMYAPRIKDTLLTLDACFQAFSKPEVLDQTDAWFCPRCKAFQPAVKTMKVWTAPDTIVVHLKRFSSIGHYRDKIENDVEYPIEGLDLSPYLAGPQANDTDGNIYDLIAISNHMGGLSGGHYVAYCLNSTTAKWYEFNDSYTRELRPESLQTASAYCLFYQRRRQSIAPLPDLEALLRSQAAEARASEPGQAADAEMDDTNDQKLWPNLEASARVRPFSSPIDNYGAASSAGQCSPPPLMGMGVDSAASLPPLYSSLQRRGPLPQLDFTGGRAFSTYANPRPASDDEEDFADAATDRSMAGLY